MIYHQLKTKMPVFSILKIHKSFLSQIIFYIPVLTRGLCSTTYWGVSLVMVGGTSYTANLTTNQSSVLYCVDQSSASITTFGPISVEYYPMWWRVRFFLLLVWLVSYCWVTCQPIRCQYCNVWTNQRSVLPTPPRGTWLPPTAGSGCGTEGSSPSSLQQRVWWWIIFPIRNKLSKLCVGAKFCSKVCHVLIKDEYFYSHFTME